MPRPYVGRQQQHLGVSVRAIKQLKAKQPSAPQLEQRIVALERQATHCDVFFPWPALAASLRSDADELRGMMSATTQEKS